MQKIKDKSSPCEIILRAKLLRISQGRKFRINKILSRQSTVDSQQSAI